MKAKKVIDKIKTDEFVFKIQRIAGAYCLDRGLRIASERIVWQVWEDIIGSVVRGIFDLATQEEPIQEIPADWWQHFKLRWFPRWLKRRFPVRMVWVVAIHKWPELQVPSLGREYLHLTVVDSDKLMKELEGDEPKE